MQELVETGWFNNIKNQAEMIRKIQQYHIIFAPAQLTCNKQANLEQTRIKFSGSGILLVGDSLFGVQLVCFHCLFILDLIRCKNSYKEVIVWTITSLKKQTFKYLINNIQKNLPILLGLVGFYRTTIQNYTSRAILPYCQALCKFVPHIQQLDMESNGKRVNMQGKVLPY